jgi:phage protein D/phage baseplate assembly protein gpV
VAEALPIKDPPDSPAFALKVAGAAVERAVADDVLLIDVHEEIGKLARATVLVQNWKDDTNEVKYSDGDTFKPGAAIELQLGYDSDLTTVFEGVIVALGADFLPNRQPVLRVEARCKGSLLAGGRRSRVLEESSDGDAVSAIAGDYGLGADADAGAQNPFVVQDGLSDWDYLRDRAERLGMAFYVRGDTVVFHAPQASGQPLATLTYGETLLELRIEQDLNGRSDTVTAAGWDPEALEAATSESSAADATVPVDGRPALGDALGGAGWAKRDTRLAHAGSVGADELDAVAKGEVARQTLGHLAGRGRSHGVPALRIDGIVDIKKLGSRFGGKHYLTAVRHVLETKSYVTEFQVGAPPRLRPEGQCCRGAAAEFLGIGIVDDIDDPNGWGRVRVLLPWLDAAVSSVWARLALPAAGDKRGFFFIPEIGDEVVVGFLGGDPRYPVVLGSLWNGTQAPPETLDAQKNAIRAIVSRAGHKLTFDDSDDAPKVQIKTKAGQTATLDDTSGSEKIELVDKTGNKLTMESKGITLEAASGGITLKASSGEILLDGMKLSGKAAASAKLESSATFDVKAAATLGLKGALVNIN